MAKNIVAPTGMSKKYFCPKCKCKDIVVSGSKASCPTCNEVYNGTYDAKIKRHKGPWIAKDGSMLRYRMLLGCCGKV
jgi:hypothetical protein